MRVGVLALQGGFAAHARAVTLLGHAPIEVRALRDLRGVQALILPGGESTVMLDLLARDRALEHALIDLVDSGAPVLATCAGLILIASRVHTQPESPAESGQHDGVASAQRMPADPEQRSLGLLDVEVRRNARGRQVHSSQARDDSGRLPLVLIRAPRITRVGSAVEVLATFEGEPVLVREGRCVGATFHPELTDDLSVHAHVLDGVPLPTQRTRVSIDESPRGSSSSSGPSTAVTSMSGAASAIR